MTKEKKKKKKKKDAHIIVLGNEKGGTGKSTLAMHIVVGLLEAGKKVAVIDLDARQKSVARYLQNRQAFMDAGGAEVKLPKLSVVRQSEKGVIKNREQDDQENLQNVLNEYRHDVDFIVIDCPGNDTYLRTFPG